MTISEYLDSKEIKPIELKSNFNLVKILEIDIFSHKGCFNCEDKINQQSLRSGAWTHAQYCWSCKSINLVYETDRMGGWHKDTIEVYQEK